MKSRVSAPGAAVTTGFAFTLLLAASATAADAQEAPTFSADVAPILFENCVRCHQPEGLGPMSLLTYDDARRWASRISEQVQSRNMPPWHLDRTVGIQAYKNDISLTDEEVTTLVQWASSGAPEGDRAALPPVPDLPNGSEFQLTAELGPPDFVIESTPYTVQANAQDQWWTPTTSFEGIIEGPRYVRATELKGSYPQGVRVLHHGHVTLAMTDSEGRRSSRPLGRQGVGKGGDLFPQNTGMLIQPEGQINWNLHYFPIDEVVEDERAVAAVWLYPEGYVPEYETVGEQRFTADMGGDMPWAGDIVLAPHSVKAQQGVHVLSTPALISSFRPHMHMRGRAQSLEAIYPDGRREMLGRVDNYSHFWQISYEFEDNAAPLLPRGTVLLITTIWDNTADNPINPDPRQWVVFGQRGVDEMSHTWLGMTYLTDEQFERLSAQRTQMASVGDGG